MRHLADEAGLGGEILTASAATSYEEIGNPAYPPMVKLLAERGIDCRAHRARRLTAEDGLNYDLIAGMDYPIIRAAGRILGADHAGKIRLLLSFAGEDREISDPWYSGNFTAAMQDIDRGCRALLASLTGRPE